MRKSQLFDYLWVGERIETPNTHSKHLNTVFAQKINLIQLYRLPCGYVQTTQNKLLA